MMDRDDIDQRMAEADQELKEMAYAAMDRLHAAGAKPDDIQFIGWLAGCADWKPKVNGRGLDA